MGEMADDAYNGLICQYCGAWMPEVEKFWNDKKKLQEFFNNPPGYPRICPECKKEKQKCHKNLIF